MKLTNMDFRRVRHRMLEELDAIRKIAKLTSWSDAITTFHSQSGHTDNEPQRFKEYPFLTMITL